MASNVDTGDRGEQLVDESELQPEKIIDGNCGFV